jgi:hypothetical protein
VFSVSPAIDPGARSILVTVRVDENAERIHDGDYVSAFIMVERNDTGLRLPRNALVFEDDKVYAHVVDEASSSATRKQLQIGLGGTEMFSISDGLAAGDLVVTRGRRKLGEGTAIDVVQVESLPDLVPDGVERPSDAAAKPPEAPTEEGAK